MGRPTLWAPWGGVYHVALSCATVGRGVVSRFACDGRSSTLWGVEVTTWYGQKYQEHRVCKRCLAILKAAGEHGSIVAAAKVKGRA